jgi:UDP-N-acetylglucosamine--N-acetylmuramyl-(pentapeptide) pyrophosphoryl-undecaprenol N-acetylglucosamine transferase
MVIKRLPKVLILAGGGGHTGYARILAEELAGKARLSFLAPDDEPISIQRLIPFGDVATIVKPRHPKTPLWRFLLRFIKSFYQSIEKVTDANVVISTGSNFCVPPAIVAWIKGIPIINLESRVKLTKPSGTAKFIGRIATINALQWEEQKEFHQGVVYGPLLPKRLVEPWDGGYCLITGGTYGYVELFEAAASTDLRNIVLQTGKIDPDRYIQLHPEWRVITFTDKFYELIAGAQVVVTPPGGTPIEAIAYGKNIVIASYPEWTKAADRDETIVFAKKLNAILLENIGPKTLKEAIDSARKKEPIKLEDGTKKLCNAILTLAIENSETHLVTDV